MSSPILNRLFELFKNSGNPLSITIEDNPEWGFKASLKTKADKQIVHCQVRKIEDVHTCMEECLTNQSAELLFNDFRESTPINQNWKPGDPTAVEVK